MSEAYIIGSEELPVNIKGSITKTGRIRYVNTLEPGASIELFNTDKEVILQSLFCRFTNDHIAKESFMLNLGGADYSPISRNIDNYYSSFIIPTICVYDSVLQTLVNDEQDKIVVLRNEIRTKGLRLTLRNRDTKNAHRIQFIAVYSEVE